VFLHKPATWSLTLREKRILRVFENRVLTRIFGPKRDEVTGGRKKLYNEEFQNLYSSPSIITMISVKEDEMGRACSTNGREGECISDIGGKARRKETNRKVMMKVGAKY
jgi:hypothetical protein